MGLVSVQGLISLQTSKFSTYFTCKYYYFQHIYKAFMNISDICDSLDSWLYELQMLTNVEISLFNKCVWVSAISWLQDGQ
jgi:thiaminase